MHNIYLAQVSFSFSSVPYVYFPYSVGSIWAYAKTNSVIAETYHLGRFIYLKEDIEQAVNSLDNPYLVGFSIYVWNTKYSLALAKAIKNKYPECVIVFGGPNVPTNPEHWLEEHNYIDYIILQEGEQAFTNLLLHLKDANHTDLPGVCYIKNDIYTYSAPVRLLSLDDIPSPYTTGLFTDVILDAKAKNLILNVVIETDRGCPYQCTFCDWGSLTYQKVKKLNLDRVFSEITWIAENKIELVQQANANFGMFVERDSSIIDHVCAEHVRTGWPKIFDGSWAKLLKPVHLDMVDKLLKYKLFRRFTASVQTFNPDTLDIIKRKNITMGQFHTLLGLCREKGIPFSTEVILGLPGETAESYKNGVIYCIERDIVYYASLLTTLQNSEMTDPAYMAEHGIIMKEVLDNSSEYADSTTLLIAHNLLTEQEYIDLVIWNWLVTIIYGYRAYNHIIKRASELGYSTAYLLESIVHKLRTDSVITHIIEPFNDHIATNKTYSLAANGIVDLDVEVISKLNEQTDKEVLQWWQSIAHITIDDVIHQRLSVNRSYEPFDEIYNGRRYISEPIPSRYANWQSFIILTRQNAAAERTITSSELIESYK